MSSAIATALMAICAAQASPAPNSRADEGYEDAVLSYLRPALLAAKKAGRLYYVVPCKDPDKDFPVPFPEITVQAPLKDHRGLETVREIFRDDKRVKVSEETGDILKVRIGEMPSTILQTKISLLRLKPLEQYDPTSAVMALLNTRAVRAAMQKLHLDEAPTIYHIPGNLPAKAAPHLPTVIKNVTLDQALDQIASTFGVIIVYGECAGGNGGNFIRIRAKYLQVDYR